MKTNGPGRIQIHGRGVGEIGDDEVERHAAEIARMDGRTEVGDQDRYRARLELANPGAAAPPEADETVYPVETWSKGAASQGHRATRVESDDEQTVAEQLVEEGVEEADLERRLAASDDDS